MFWVRVWHAHTQPAAAATRCPTPTHREDGDRQTDQQPRGCKWDGRGLSGGTTEGCCQRMPQQASTPAALAHDCTQLALKYIANNTASWLLFLLFCFFLQEDRPADCVKHPPAGMPPAQSLQSSGLTLSETSMGRCVQGQRRVCSRFYQLNNTLLSPQCGDFMERWIYCNGSCTLR